MRKLILGALLSCAVFPAHATDPAKWDWVKVTKQIPACEAAEENDREHCVPGYLKVGDLLEVSYGLGVPKEPNLIRLWRGVCPHGCVPFMTPVWISRDDWPSAFKPVPTPKNWR